MGPREWSGVGLGEWGRLETLGEGGTEEVVVGERSYGSASGEESLSIADPDDVEVVPPFMHDEPPVSPMSVASPSQPEVDVPQASRPPGAPPCPAHPRVRLRLDYEPLLAADADAGHSEMKALLNELSSLRAERQHLEGRALQAESQRTPRASHPLLPREARIREGGAEYSSKSCCCAARHHSLPR
eukprot:2112737-Pleurochrysis_carterae.AAC.1